MIRNSSPVEDGSSKIPLAAKLAGAVFLAILVPIYLRTYGPSNFLWFCDAALILTVAGMWLESPLLISMCAAGILVPQCLWLVDFGGNLLGFHLLGLTRTSMSSSGLPGCGSPPSSPLIWSCAKSSPRHRPRRAGKGPVPSLCPIRRRLQKWIQSVWWGNTA